MFRHTIEYRLDTFTREPPDVHWVVSPEALASLRAFFSAIEVFWWGVWWSLAWVKLVNFTDWV